MTAPKYQRSKTPAEVREVVLAYLRTSEYPEGWIQPHEISDAAADDLILARELWDAIDWIEEYERWASSMPDAGLAADDPRSSWYMRRPQYPNFRAVQGGI